MKLIKVIGMSLTLLSTSVLADIAVIVHPSNANALDNAMVSRIFTGKAKSFADGNKVIPVNQSSGSAVAEEFNKKALNKSSSQLKAYWSKLVFTGKGTPPKEVGSDAEVISLVAANPNIIGYVSKSAVDGSVKVVASY